jgi:hypothetical protein
MLVRSAHRSNAPLREPLACPITLAAGCFVVEGAVFERGEVAVEGGF